LTASTAHCERSEAIYLFALVHSLYSSFLALTNAMK
jgi:hypothetical protein